jgi:hypothetical protein
MSLAGVLPETCRNQSGTVVHCPENCNGTSRQNVSQNNYMSLNFGSTNQAVGGSNPSGRAIQRKKAHRKMGLFYLLGLAQEGSNLRHPIKDWFDKRRRREA